MYCTSKGNWDIGRGGFIAKGTDPFAAGVKRNGRGMMVASSGKANPIDSVQYLLICSSSCSLSGLYALCDVCETATGDVGKKWVIAWCGGQWVTVPQAKGKGDKGRGNRKPRVRDELEVFR